MMNKHSLKLGFLIPNECEFCLQLNRLWEVIITFLKVCVKRDFNNKLFVKTEKTTAKTCVNWIGKIVFKKGKIIKKTKMAYTNATSDGQTNYNVTIEVCAGKYEDYKFPLDTGEWFLVLMAK